MRTRGTSETIMGWVIAYDDIRVIRAMTRDERRTVRREGGLWTDRRGQPVRRRSAGSGFEIRRGSGGRTLNRLRDLRSSRQVDM